MELVDKTTYQGRITYLVIAFLQQTGLGFRDIAHLRIRDVYQLGIVRISVQVGYGGYQRILPLNEKARNIVADILKAQACYGLQPFTWCHLFRMPSGRPFDPHQLAALFWLYLEAAQRLDAS